MSRGEFIFGCFIGRLISLNGREDGSGSAMSTSQIVTHGIYEHADPKEWREHRFGLPPERWHRLSERSFWVTGAGAGFGRSVAVGLAASGAKVILSGRRSEKLEESLDEMRSFDIPTDNCHTIPVDITNEEGVQEACLRIKHDVGFLTGLVNNAGTFVTGLGPWPLMEQRPEDWDRQFNLNVKGQWLVTHAALPLMLRGGEVKVLFVTSEAGWAFTPSAGHYNVSKAALNSLGASFAAECEARHPDVDVQINIVVPGEARSEMNQGSDTSPYTLDSIVLALLSHPDGGPNGRFFFKDGRHLTFGYAPVYEKQIL